MKKLSALILLSLSSAVWSASETVTLFIPAMNCPTCPITVRIALNKVPGVMGVGVDLRSRQAMVAYDTKKTNVDAITQATKQAGFPATVLGVTQ